MVELEIGIEISNSRVGNRDKLRVDKQSIGKNTGKVEETEIRNMTFLQ